jgi:hypothetical protein
MLKLREADIRALATGGEHSSADVFNILSRLPQVCDDADVLFDVAQRVAGSVTDTLILTLRLVVILLFY